MDTDSGARGASARAVERAAKAWFDRIQAQRLDAGRKRLDGQRWQWSDLTERDRNGYRALVAPIVRAVLTEEDA